MSAIELWLAQHPLAQAALLFVALAALTAVGNWLTRWESPEAWERAKVEHPRLAAAVSLMRALGLDPVKAVRALATLLRGRWGNPPTSPTEPPKTEAPDTKPPPSALRIAFAVMALVGLSSCSLTSAQVRSGLLLTGRGVVEANRVCSHVAQELAASKPTEALEMARTCTRVSNATFATLEAGEHALDAANQKAALCAISSGLEGMKSVLTAARAAFGDDSIPKPIADAVTVGSSLAALVAGQCEVAR